ncbi:tetratricopeptide repeat protein [Citrobacter braakii]
MITSKEVFAKRKEGAIDEAYRMALELMATPNADDWDKKAFCWCLIDVIKRDARNGNNENLTHYRRQLESIDADPSDEVLAKGVRNALSLCNPGGREISEAKALGKEGRHAEAAAAYRKALAARPADRDAQTGFGWALYKHSKELMAVENVNLGAVKRNLNDYLKLDVEKPSLLHSCILQLAAKLAGQDKFSMLVFARLWNLNNLRPEDYERFRAEDGKEYSSLAEKVIQQVGKEAAAADSAREQEQVLPHLNAAIERFPDNVWLKLDKAKILLSLGKHEEALTFGLAVVKAKPNDYWAWGLVGDIVSRTDWEAALGCYCKALSCPAEDKFTGKIRLKAAQHMLQSKDFDAAKLEVDTIVRAKESEGHKIPEEAAEIASQPWFTETVAASSNRDYYKSKLPAAEALLYGNLPWVNACIGEKFTVVEKEGKQKHKRKIFLETSSIPVEATIPESKLGGKKWSIGDPIKVKGEFDDNQRFMAFVIDGRETKSSWDVFRESIGVVDHVNREKGVLHFIVDREIDGVIPLSELETAFSEGDSIALRLSRYTSKHGPACRVQNAEASDKEPSERVKKPFREEIRVSDGMGFTASEIFIPPPMVSRHQLNDGQTVSGKAVLNFNKKRGNWGWKAIFIADD